MSIKCDQGNCNEKWDICESDYKWTCQGGREARAQKFHETQLWGHTIQMYKQWRKSTGIDYVDFAHKMTLAGRKTSQQEIFAFEQGEFLPDMEFFESFTGVLRDFENNEQKIVSLREFMNENGLTIVINYIFNTNVIHASFKNDQLIFPNATNSPFGNGKSFDEAAENLCKEISNQEFIFNTIIHKNKKIKIPKIIVG